MLNILDGDDYFYTSNNTDMPICKSIQYNTIQYCTNLMVSWFYLECFVLYSSKVEVWTSTNRSKIYNSQFLKVCHRSSYIYTVIFIPLFHN